MLKRAPWQLDRQYLLFEWKCIKNAKIMNTSIYIDFIYMYLPIKGSLKAVASWHVVLVPVIWFSNSKIKPFESTKMEQKTNTVFMLEIMLKNRHTFTIGYVLYDVNESFHMNDSFMSDDRWLFTIISWSNQGKQRNKLLSKYYFKKWQERQWG